MSTNNKSALKNNGVKKSTSTSTTKKTNSKPKLSKGVEEEVRFRLKKQEETHKIQSMLIQSAVDSEYLKHVASHLQPNHYEDVVTERSLAGLCGYPICSNSISVAKLQKSFANRGQQQISPKTGLIFDGLEFNSFCSETCIAASRYYVSQLELTPVYMRTSTIRVELLKFNSTPISHNNGKSETRNGVVVDSTTSLDMMNEQRTTNTMELNVIERNPSTIYMAPKYNPNTITAFQIEGVEVPVKREEKKKTPKKQTSTTTATTKKSSNLEELDDDIDHTNNNNVVAEKQNSTVSNVLSKRDLMKQEEEEAMDIREHLPEEDMIGNWKPNKQQEQNKKVSKQTKVASSSKSSKKSVSFDHEDQDEGMLSYDSDEQLESENNNSEQEDEEERDRFGSQQREDSDFDMDENFNLINSSKQEKKTEKQEDTKINSTKQTKTQIKQRSKSSNNSTNSTSTTTTTTPTTTIGTQSEIDPSTMVMDLLSFSDDRPKRTHIGEEPPFGVTLSSLESWKTTQTERFLRETNFEIDPTFLDNVDEAYDQRRQIFSQMVNSKLPQICSKLKVMQSKVQSEISELLRTFSYFKVVRTYSEDQWNIFLIVFLELIRTRQKLCRQELAFSVDNLKATLKQCNIGLEFFEIYMRIFYEPWKLESNR